MRTLPGAAILCAAIAARAEVAPRCTNLLDRRDSARGPTLGAISPSAAPSTGGLSPTSDPAYAPSTSDLFTAALAAGKEGTTVRAAFKPFRLTGIRPLWGLELGGASPAGKPTTLSVSYRFEYRWLAPGAVTAWFKERALEECSRIVATTPAISDRDLVAAVAAILTTGSNAAWFELLPVLTIGGDAGFFFLDSTKSVDQNSPGSQSASLKIDWRLGPLAGTAFEMTGTVALSRERSSANVAQEYAPYRSYSASAVWVIPQVLGTSAFDDEYVKSGLQRGLGVGFAFVGKDCTETDPTRVAMCSPKRERYYGGIVDFRLAAAVKPRLSLGVHEYDAPTLPGTLRGFEVAVQIASALHE